MNNRYHRIICPPGSYSGKTGLPPTSMLTLFPYFLPISARSNPKAHPSCGDPSLLREPGLCNPASISVSHSCILVPTNPDSFIHVSQGRVRLLPAMESFARYLAHSRCTLHSQSVLCFEEYFIPLIKGKTK